MAGLTGLLVGYGSIGRRHLANLHSLGVHDWAVVHTGAGTVPFEPPCPVRSYGSLSEALDAEAPSFAVVANPTALHLPTALACVARGCDLLLEKPVSHTSDGLGELSQAVADGGNRVVMGFQFRFDPGLRRVRRLLAEGAVGDPLHVRVVWGEYLPSWHPWEDWRVGYAASLGLGGGVHHTLSHPLDYLRMLFGDATVVNAALTHHGHLGLEVAEAADIGLRLPGGVIAHVHLDYWSRPSTHRMEVVGEEGTIVWDYMAGQVRVWRDGAGGWSSERYPGVDERNDLFLAEARNLLEVVRGSAAPVCTLDDGISAVRLCAAVEAAAGVGERPLTEAS